MEKISNHQIADLLLVAKKRLSYSQYIADYPEKIGAKHFDILTPADSFYKNICNACFNDSLLMTATLLDKNDTRVISFWNRGDFVSNKKQEISEIYATFESAGLKTMRDQIVGHADSNNLNNYLPHNRAQGIVNADLIKKLYAIQEALVNLFREHMKEYGMPYSPKYFDVAESLDEIKLIMGQAKPKMTNDFVI